ncbi:IS3 family transposase [Lentisphaera profundi]|uniref:IS3 family transposase n=1 Tax=Lentisphaera profundi TaxID=1658616 RepID=UPI003B6774DD
MSNKRSKVSKGFQEEDFHCNHKRVTRLMKDNNIRSKTVKKFKITTDSNHEYLIFG